MPHVAKRETTAVRIIVNSGKNEKIVWIWDEIDYINLH